MRRKPRSQSYSDEFTLIIMCLGLALVLTRNILIALGVGALALMGYVGWEIHKEFRRREAFRAWFHNNRGMDNLDGMSPLQFEAFVGELFTRLGYQTQMTPRSGDEGIDVIARKDGKLHAIQVKKTAKAVGSPVIQTLTGSMVHIQADFGICVSSGGFTPPARQFAQGKNITLIDKEDLTELLKKIRR